MQWMWAVTVLGSVGEPVLMDEVVQEQTDEGVQEPTGVDEEPSEKLLDLEQLDDPV